MRNVSVAGQFSRRPRLIGSFFGDFGAPGEAGQRWQPPVPFEQSTGSRDRTPASGGVRFVPRRPAPSTGTGLGASASLSPSAPSAGASRSQRPGNRVATNGPRLLQPARRRLTGKVNMATTERGILEGKVLPELQAIASSMGVQGIQRLRKADLIGAIIAKAQGVEFVPSSAPSKSRRAGTTTEASTAETQAPDRPELPGAGEAEAQAPASDGGPERRTRRRSRSSGDTEPAATGEAPTAVEVSGNGGQPAAAGAPPATLTEPSSNGEVTHDGPAGSGSGPSPAGGAAAAPAAAEQAVPAAEAGAPPATRTDGAQADQAQQGQQSQDQGGDRGQRRDRDRDRDWNNQGGGNR